MREVFLNTQRDLGEIARYIKANYTGDFAFISENDVICIKEIEESNLDFLNLQSIVDSLTDDMIPEVEIEISEYEQRIIDLEEIILGLMESIL